MARRQSLADWIREAMLDPDKDGKISMLSLVHMAGTTNQFGQQQLEVHSTKLAPGVAAAPADLAALFQGKAESYAQDLPGVQSFCLLAFYAGSSEPQARHPFLITGKVDFEGGATETPDPRGEKQQSMRHSEMLIQQVYRRQQVMDDYSIRLLERANNTVAQLSNENREMFAIFKEMMMEKVMGEHNREMERLKYERETEERKKWLSFAPALVNTILGREVFPQASADTALIETIAESLSMEDVGRLAAANVIKPEILGPLYARFEQAEKKRLAKIEERKRLMPPSKNPENEAGGDVQ
jgi:hypothetical protein